MDGQSTTFDWVSPWFTIWTSPRATIRRIVDSDPSRFTIGIAWIAGALAALNFETEMNAGVPPANFAGSAWLASSSSEGLAIVAFMLGVGGVVMLYLLAMLYRWSGGVLGGTAQVVEVRSALAWAQVPAIYITVLGVLAVIVGLTARDAQSTTYQSFSWWALIQAVLGIWAFIILLKTLGEVHRFSAWRALAATIIGALAVAGVALGIGLLFVMALLIGRAIV
jgi:hypothetical protein